MEEIKNNLPKNEEVLWFHEENTDLTYFIKMTLIFIICSFIMVPVCNIYIFYFIGEIEKLILFLSFIIIDGFLMLLAVFNYKKLKNRLNLTYRKLKNYKEFVILTNKRYIRRNYYLNFKVNLSRYIFENALEQIGDVLYIKLEKINKVIVDYNISEINLHFQDDPILSPFYIKFKKIDLKEVQEIIKLLIKLLNLVRVEQKPHYEKYIRNTS